MVTPMAAWSTSATRPETKKGHEGGLRSPLFFCVCPLSSSSIRHGITSKEMPISTSDRHLDNVPAGAASGLSGRALLGWMDKEEAIRFLIEDCLFSASLTVAAATEIWESRKAIVDEMLVAEQLFAPRKLPLSDADLKAVRKFRTRHPHADSVIDFVKLNPLDLVVNRFWISTVVADGFRDQVSPEKWLQTALLDPPTNPGFTWRREGEAVFFNLPHREYFLCGPRQPDGQIRVSEAEGFVTVALHAERALLWKGYHRTFACAQGILEAVNAPRGVLFGVSNFLASMGSEAADKVLRRMEKPRPPLLRDFFDDRLFLPVTLKRRRYRMQIRYEVAEVTGEEANAADTANRLSTRAAQDGLQSRDRDGAPSRADQPGNPHRIFDEAVRQHQAGKIDEAMMLYEHALFLKPDYADAHNNLGMVLAERDRIHEAAEHFEIVVTLEPGHAGARHNLATALARQGNLDDAAVQFRQALAINHQNPEAHTGLGNVLQNQGRFEEAMAQFEQALAIKPAHAEAYFHRAEIKTFQPGDSDLAAMEAIARRSDLAPQKAAYIHFAAAKALEDCRDYGPAFEHLRQGNELKRKLIDYNEPELAKDFRRVARIFDRNLLDRLQGEGDPSSVPVFVLGMPRSGSTLVEQILGSHPQVYPAGELGDLYDAERSVLNAAGQTMNFPEYVSTLDGASFRRIGEAYVARLTARANGQQRIIDKLPGNYLKIGLIRMILPNARIIHTMRDPVDTCLSCYSKLFTGGHDFSYDLAELGRHYRRYTKLMDHWRSVLPAGAMLDISYEELVDDIEGQARRLIEYCGLAWDDRCIAFHRNERPVRTASAVQVRQPLFRSSLQRWRKYEANLGPLLQELGDLAPGGATEGVQPH